MLRMTLKPFKYLLIKHDDKKWFDMILPAILAALISCAYYFLEKPFAIVATGGLIPQINSLLQMLIGFYIASLAAISTFGNENIDELMAGNPPTLKMKEKGEWHEIPLTRRRFHKNSPRSKLKMRTVAQRSKRGTATVFAFPPRAIT